MSLIDQRILISAPAEAIWGPLTPPAMLTRWQQGVKQVSILSTRQTGIGARRRIDGSDGRATVEETTAWLENIGYEYVVIDGPYKTFKGRFRLQAVPEGTIVNWTVEYQLKGALAGLRNMLNHQRKLEDQMVGSLRQLKKTVESSGVKIDPEKHSKAAMQAAPSVEDRAARRPAPELTQVSGSAVGASGTPPYPTKPIILDEDDVPASAPSREAGALTVASIPMTPTDPPMPAVKAEPTLVAASSVLSTQPAQKPPPIITDSEDDTKPRPPAGLREAISAQQPTPVESMEEVNDPGALTVPISLVAPPRPPDPDTQTIEVPAVNMPEGDPVPSIPSALPERIPTDPKFLFKPVEENEKTPPRGIPIIEPEISSLDDTHPTSPVIVPPEIAGLAASPSSEPPHEEVADVPVDPSIPPPTGKRDTGEVSIWDRFGVQRPSERTKAELEAVMASITPLPIPAVEIPPAAPKVSKRHALKRKARPSVRAKAPKPPRHKRHIPVRRR